VSRSFCIVLSCAGRDKPSDRPRSRTKCLQGFTVSDVNSELQRARDPKVKGKFDTVLKQHTIKTYGGSGHIRNLCTAWRRMVSFMLRPIYLRGHGHHYPLNNSFCPCRKSNSGRPARSQSLAAHATPSHCRSRIFTEINLGHFTRISYYSLETNNHGTSRSFVQKQIYILTAFDL
jgi:hypothetical protein